MSIFDRFKRRPKVVRQGFAEINLGFTAEENEAINKTLEGYAAVANAGAPEGTAFVVPPKVRCGMAAQGLTGYVESLIKEMQECGSEPEVRRLVEKAIGAQTKAYAVHNLPIYLFQLAELFEAVGNGPKSREFFQHFLRAQHEFDADEIDAMFLSQAGADLPMIISLAKEKASPTEPNLVERADLLGRSTAYKNPVEQIMFILGFKCDPKFDTFVHALMHGANPGIMDIVESTNIEAAIFGNLRACAMTVQKLQDQRNAGVISELKDDIYQLIVRELDETHYGGRWFEDAQLPSDDWVNMGKYSPLFVRGSRVFCLPRPYFDALSSIV